MSFTDALKRSLGFEENENKNSANDFHIMDRLRDLAKPRDVQNQQNNAQQQRPAPRQPRQAPPQTPNPKPVWEDDDVYVISPEQSFYEIVLIRPKTIDDINYVVDQVIEENNPVILDLSFLEKESPANFKLAGDKIKQMRAHYGAQALLLARSAEKNLIIVSPRRVQLSNKSR